MPTFREAVFWVYVRQCLYNATINQEPLDIDFSLQLHPPPDSLEDSHPLAWLRSETAWSNQVLWHTAFVANFCFRGAGTQSESASRIRQWQELWETIQTWHKSRPRSFDQIGSGPSSDGSVFPDIWFTADWHGKPKQVTFSITTHSASSNLICLLSLLMYPTSQIQAGARICDPLCAWKTVTIRRTSLRQAQSCPPN